MDKRKGRQGLRRDVELAHELFVHGHRDSRCHLPSFGKPIGKLVEQRGHPARPVVYATPEVCGVYIPISDIVEDRGHWLVSASKWGRAYDWKLWNATLMVTMTLAVDGFSMSEPRMRLADCSCRREGTGVSDPR